ncbi:MAG: hypothetical protein M3494_17125 [Actinomycetota bacterium]|jgi:hypothetical protein|nr:hypothetical protein [Rubrobacter sp.]MDQ3509702.1 hypothetical protein [Actinomycetota bacterium]
MPIQALILLAILAASAILFTIIFVIVANRELAKPEGAGERGDANTEREDDIAHEDDDTPAEPEGDAGHAKRGENPTRAERDENAASENREEDDVRAEREEDAGHAERGDEEPSRVEREENDEGRVDRGETRDRPAEDEKKGGGINRESESGESGGGRGA